MAEPTAITAPPAVAEPTVVAATAVAAAPSLAAGPPLAANDDQASEDLANEDLASTSQVETATASDAAPVGASPVSPLPVNYDDEGLVEVTLDEDIYRFDAGKQGTAVCLSRRSVGVWSWEFLGELRWDGKDLRSRTLDRKLLALLSQHLKQASAETNY